jgi:hypothetical protein
LDRQDVTEEISSVGEGDFEPPHSVMLHDLIEIPLIDAGDVLADPHPSGRLLLQRARRDSLKSFRSHEIISEPLPVNGIKPRVIRVRASVGMIPTKGRPSIASGSSDWWGARGERAVPDEGSILDRHQAAKGRTKGERG